MPELSLLFLHNKNVSIVRHDPQQNAVDQAELVYFIIRAACHRVCTIRVGNHELLLFIESVKHDEMPHRLAVDIVKDGLVIFVCVFAGGAVKIGGAKAAKHRNVALEIAFEHACTEVCCSDCSAKVNESDIGVNSFFELGRVFCLVQSDQFFAEFGHLELAPRGVKNLEIVRINGRLESALEGVDAKENA